MIDKKAKKWNKNNKWFGKNKSLTLVAIYFHEQLVDINVNPKTNKYYNIIRHYHSTLFKLLVVYSKRGMFNFSAISF